MNSELQNIFLKISMNANPVLAKMVANVWTGYILSLVSVLKDTVVQTAA